MPRSCCSNQLELIRHARRRGLWAALLVPVCSQHTLVTLDTLPAVPSPPLTVTDGAAGVEEHPVARVPTRGRCLRRLAAPAAAAAAGSRAGAAGEVEQATSENGFVQVVVLADTHAPRRWRVCPPQVAEHLRPADLILHAGDVCTAAVLAELAEYAPVTAVLGNNDGPDVAEWGAPRTAELNLDGLSVAMVHDSGAAAGRLTRLRRRFPSADLVVFGHSHIPLDESAPGLRIFNPGSPTDRRRQPHGTLGLLQIEDGRLIQAAIVPVT